MGIGSRTATRNERAGQIAFAVRLPPTDAVGTTGNSAALASAQAVSTIVSQGGFLSLDGALSASWFYTAQTTTPKGHVYLALPTTITFLLSASSTCTIIIKGRDHFGSPVLENINVSATTLIRSKYAYSFIEYVQLSRGDAADATTLQAGWHWRNNTTINQGVPLPIKLTDPMGNSVAGSQSTFAATGKHPADVIAVFPINLGGGAAAVLSVGGSLVNSEAVSGANVTIDYAASVANFASGGTITQPTTMQEWMVVLNKDALKTY